MTHVQKIWTAGEALSRCKDVTQADVRAVRQWMQPQQNLPQCVTDEQIILFLHSCYSDMDATKKCIEEYYKLRLNYPNFFENRDVETLKTTLDVLDYAILPMKTKEGYQIVYHKLNDTDPQKYNFYEGFKLLVMMIDAVYVKQGPLSGLVLLFDLRGVKIGHLTRIPILAVKKGMDYLQEAIPVRLQAIHILNTHSIMDKILLLLRPFMKKSFFNLIHFHKEDAESVFETFSKSCLPEDYGGDVESIRTLHEQFKKELQQQRPMFLEEEALMLSHKKNSSAKKTEQPPINLAKLEID